MLHKTSFVWFRFFRRKTYPWLVIAIATSRFTYLDAAEKDKEKVRLVMALAKIDFVKFYAFVNDLLW